MALMSFIFMFVVGILSNGFYLLPGTDEDVLLELMSFISFFGSVLFLLEGRKVLSGWYLAITFCISLFLLVSCDADCRIKFLTSRNKVRDARVQV